jgi:hypothetical protein
MVPQQATTTEAHEKKHIKHHHHHHHKHHGHGHGHDGHGRKHKHDHGDAAGAAGAASAGRAEDSEELKDEQDADVASPYVSQQQVATPLQGDGVLGPVFGFGGPVFDGVTSLQAYQPDPLAGALASLQSVDLMNLNFDTSGTTQDAAAAQSSGLYGSLGSATYDSSSSSMGTTSSSSIGSSDSSSSAAEPQVVFQSISAENWQPQGEAVHIHPSQSATPEVPAAAAESNCNPTLVQQQCDPQHPPSQSSSEGARAYWEKWRAACCKQFVPKPPEQGKNATDFEEYEIEYEYEVEGDAADEVEQRHNPPSPDARLRTDLARDAPINAEKPALQLGTCVTTSSIFVPRFETTFGGPMNTQLQTSMTYGKVDVPARLSGDLIRRVKTYAMSKMHTFDPVMGVIGPDPVRSAYVDLKWTDEFSHFTHPAGSVGPAELALLKVGAVGLILLM